MTFPHHPNTVQIIYLILTVAANLLVLGFMLRHIVVPTAVDIRHGIKPRRAERLKNRRALAVDAVAVLVCAFVAFNDIRDHQLILAALVVVVVAVAAAELTYVSLHRTAPPPESGTPQES